MKNAITNAYRLEEVDQLKAAIEGRQSRITLAQVEAGLPHTNDLRAQKLQRQIAEHEYWISRHIARLKEIVE